MKRQIPNLLTLGNLFCGCLGIAFVHVGNYGLGFLCLLLGAFFDFLDGFVARLLKVSSPLGAQLDSLSDLVTFCVLPAFMVHDLFYVAAQDFLWAKKFGFYGLNALSVYPLLFAVAGSYRLAKFNVSTDQTDGFKGLPTPAAGLFLASFGLLFHHGVVFSLIDLPWIGAYTSHPIILLAASLGLGLLMIVPIPLMALKFKNASLKDNWVKYLLLLLAVPMVFAFGFFSIQVIVVLYLLLSIVQNLSKK